MKSFLKHLFLFAAISMASTTTMKAQFKLGKVLGTVSSVMEGTSKTENILQGLTSVFSPNKTASKSQLVGTWVYTEPAIVFESENTWKEFGGRYASNLLEKNLQKKLNKIGVKKGLVKMTFTDDNKFSQTTKGRTLNGTYKINGKNIELYYGGTVKQLIGTTQLDHKTLMIVVDAGKFLPLIKQVAQLSKNNTLRTAASLLNDVKGLQCGISLQRQSK